VPELKPLHPDAVEAALERAHRYRLLNEPTESESIARDILRVRPDDQPALVMLLLSLSDQLEDQLVSSFNAAKELLPRLDDEYERLYYHGLLCERRARAHWRQGGHGSGQITYDWLRQAMDLYEQAERIRPPGNDDAILRWNACVRSMDRHREIRPVGEDTFLPLLE
jgi:hypothetical protein